MVVWDIFGSLNTEMKTISWESKLRLYKAIFFLSCRAQRSIFTKEQIKQTLNEVACRLLSLELRQF